MQESILESVKKLLGIGEQYAAFNEDLIIHINTILGVLVQMGIGREGFYITGSDETWSDFLEDTQCNLHAVKTWTALRVRLLFDPPNSGTLMEAINSNLKELEWRIYITENYIGEI